MTTKYRRKNPSISESLGMPKIIAFSGLVNLSLVVTALIVIIGQFRIENHDLKIIYSLGMVIATTVGRYGTELTYLNGIFDDVQTGNPFRHKIYLIILLFGLGGILF